MKYYFTFINSKKKYLFHFGGQPNLFKSYVCLKIIMWIAMKIEYVYGYVWFAVFVMYLTDVCSDRFTMAGQDLVGNSGAPRARGDSNAVWQMVEESWWHLHTQWERQGEQGKCLGGGQHWWSICGPALWSGCSSHCSHLWILLQLQTQHSGWVGTYQMAERFTYFKIWNSFLLLPASKKSELAMC